MMELKDTVTLMNSENYKERFKAEYYQTKIRYEKLKAFNTKIEAAHYNTTEAKVEMPKHDCPDDLLRMQQSVMGEYLHLLELRAVIEGISLDDVCRNYTKINEACPNYDNYTNLFDYSKQHSLTNSPEESLDYSSVCKASNEVKTHD